MNVIGPGPIKDNVAPAAPLHIRINAAQASGKYAIRGESPSRNAAEKGQKQ